jgi:hypothetical protein
MWRLKIVFCPYLGGSPTKYDFQTFLILLHKKFLSLLGLGLRLNEYLI